MRIVAGSAKGRPIQGPKSTSRHIRPTADRVRETLFNVLEVLRLKRPTVLAVNSTGSLKELVPS